jgi:hypothetical protein
MQNYLGHVYPSMIYAHMMIFQMSLIHWVKLEPKNLCPIPSLIGVISSLWAEPTKQYTHTHLHTYETWMLRMVEKVSMLKLTSSTHIIVTMESLFPLFN